MLKEKAAEKEFSNSLSNVKRKLEIMTKYNTTFTSYDELYREEQYEKYDSVEDYLLHIVDNDVLMLDLGCGTGLLYEYLSERCGKCHAYYVGVDISINMLKLAKKKIFGRNEKIFSDLILSDAEHLPFRNNCFDSLFSFTVIQNVPCFKCFISEAKRVNKDYGLIIISIPKKIDTSANIVYKSVFDGGHDLVFLM